ncbi:hypothetical protein [Vibrio paucivorans]|uniref:Uncharacterized protein n=1 Tax=Vibrio paucivorans TaxID=2829489 RepID=A0A9X3CHV9_9VIBR|nr:hypothetical protein [Vibrio paucivorans]MCW8335970.1 hypothetical protein [Vibrio paucivorans]
MQESEIILPPIENEKVAPLVNERLRLAYQSESKQLEVVEVELSRAKVYMIDEHGNMKKVSLLAEH